MSRRPLALLTNDDGIDSPGLHALARGALDAGYDVIVAAPSVDASGAGGSVQAVIEDGHVTVQEQEIPGLPGVTAYGVSAQPAFIVLAAGQGWLDREPDIVLSGINYGANLGRNVLHSGTVCAVIAGTMNRWSGLAVSMDTGLSMPESPHWEAPLSLLGGVLGRLRERPAGTAWTMNVPNRPVAELEPLREAELAESGAVQVRMQYRTPEGPRPAGLRVIVSEDFGGKRPDDDVTLLSLGHPTLTELAPMGSQPIGSVVHAP
ncbi:5'/3'-nucleotidase SurE [Pseudonocardia endophytica]|uniref:5'-nucleotidase n=1 Tax=Pseudonocardia endophytica TaxID=401976 RepID=A0A4R1HD30_PSEEN|nr:5'/3'-nucleotidase SurE [Pseudonocardia endophytica]TCK19947.1 5'-nucleotidase [Pseudonocardia endophytica]